MYLLNWDNKNFSKFKSKSYDIFAENLNWNCQVNYSQNSLTLQSKVQQSKYIRENSQNKVGINYVIYPVVIFENRGSKFVYCVSLSDIVYFQRKKE